jgi:hypothetical protein
LFFYGFNSVCDFLLACLERKFVEKSIRSRGEKFEMI